MSRRALSIPGFSHKNPVPSGCVKSNIVVTGGISGMDPETGVLPADLKSQCRNIFAHLVAVMDAAGGSTDDIVKLEFWMADASKKDAVNSHWLSMFPDEATRPTRQILSGDRGYAGDVLVVASLMAVLDQ